MYNFLEAYNFFISSYVHDVTYHGISNLSEYYFIKTKVIMKGLSFFASENTYFQIFQIFLLQCFLVACFAFYF